MRRTTKDLKEKKHRRILKTLNKLRNERHKAERHLGPNKVDGIKRIYQVSNKFKSSIFYQPLKDLLPLITEPGYKIPEKRYWIGADTQPEILDIDIRDFQKLTLLQRTCFDVKPGKKIVDARPFCSSNRIRNKDYYDYPKLYTLSRICRNMLYIKDEPNKVINWSCVPPSSEEKRLKNYTITHNIKKDVKKLLGWDHDWDYNKNKRSTIEKDLKKQVKRDVEEVW